jgi:uncharacterized protein YgbK (DUF1537 family)
MVTLSAERASTVWLVADDLTGAADASVPFVLQGCEATVLIDPGVIDFADVTPGVWTNDGLTQSTSLPQPASLSQGAAVLAVSTNSRGLGVDAAREAVRNGLRALRASDAGAPPALRFKKIDSTLRGHVAMETGETFEGWGCRRAVIAPAFPEMGRRLIDGRLEVHGVASDISVSDLFAQERFSSLVTTSEPAVCGGVLRDLAEASKNQTGLAFVCDSTRPDTLDAIVDALWDLRADTLWVGSAGLARALARRLADERARRQAAPQIASFEPRAGGRVLFIGSMHQVTNRQCAEFEAAGETSVILTPAGQRDAARALQDGRDVLVRMRNDTPEDLAAMVNAIAAAAPAGLVLSGGDSAVRVCEAAKVTALRLLGEVETGVPWGTCRGGAFDGLPVVLKSGGFGGADTLLHAARFLSRQEMKERS